MARALVCSLSLTVAAAFVPALRSPWTQPARRPASCATPRMASTADFKNGLTIEIDGAPVRLAVGSAHARLVVKTHNSSFSHVNAAAARERVWLFCSAS